jgi:phosphoribosylformimino-5-aminoimidazole carboxamide ribotide isomerase
MQIWPAVEIRSGKCVRPTRGDYRKQTEKETVYGESPADMALRWINDGAVGLHIVDLDAALGEPSNFEPIREIAAQADVPIQVGGGIRDEPTIQKYLDIGVARLVIATRAMQDPNWVIEMSEKYPRRILLGLDSRDGIAVSNGRLEKTDLTVIDLARQMALHPIAGIVFTDITRSGRLKGPNFKAQQQLRELVDIPVIAGGGVATVDDAVKLAALEIEGCVIGRALYEGRMTLAETQMAVQQASFRGKADRSSTPNSTNSGVST